ncbi:MAG: hypothetical protein GVY26_15800 [Bacteroidetes bacterium]|jgi:hypothetical protein|nr:hypothetical protein [Bacteroidota bacterium]
MPVIISELLIKAKVADQDNASQNSGPTGNTPAVDEDALKPIEKAVNTLTEMMKRKNER